MYSGEVTEAGANGVQHWSSAHVESVNKGWPPCPKTSVCRGGQDGSIACALLVILFVIGAATAWIANLEVHPLLREAEGLFVDQPYGAAGALKNCIGFS